MDGISLIRTIMDNHRDVALYKQALFDITCMAGGDCTFVRPIYHNEIIDSALDAIFMLKLKIQKLEDAQNNVNQR